MSVMFSVSELIQVGVEDERSGVALYTALAAKTRNPDLRKTYQGLAEQERYHQARFEAMLKTAGQYQPGESYDQEYVTYLHALEADRAFPDADTAVRLAGQCAGDAESLLLALGFERDTLVLMNEMRHMVREKDQAVVDELIREEQSHLVALTAARKKLLG